MSGAAPLAVSRLPLIPGAGLFSLGAGVACVGSLPHPASHPEGAGIGGGLRIGWQSAADPEVRWSWWFSRRSFGSGSVLLAFLPADFIQRPGWVSGAQRLDAVVVGPVTPGPVFTTATFVGHLVGSFRGVILVSIDRLLPVFLVLLCATTLGGLLVLYQMVQK
jgi:chromate transporter